MERNSKAILRDLSMDSIMIKESRNSLAMTKLTEIQRISMTIRNSQSNLHFHKKQGHQLPNSHSLVELLITKTSQIGERNSPLTQKNNIALISQLNLMEHRIIRTILSRRI